MIFADGRVARNRSTGVAWEGGLGVLQDGENPRRERLGRLVGEQELGCSGLEGFEARFGLAVTSQDDGLQAGSGRVVPQGVEDLEACQPRELEVEQEQVGPLAADEVESRGTVAGFVHGVVGVVTQGG
jgi:hypothetical protein